ncbi:MAG: OmpH family outer membrane protein [Verrucomicrobia bacterium]|nr:OmpH family outer membrane protein [Verrucomicrobiota bacterium]MCH8527757.1 OmpH family outer membrane protein [Kiritimatiellia bacterium]
MKKLPGIFLLLTLLTGIQTALSAQNIVVVNMDRVFNEFHRTREAEQQVQELIQQFRMEQQETQQNYQALQQAFSAIRETAGDIALSDEDRRAKANEASEILNRIRAMEEEIRSLEQQRQQQIEEQGRRMRQQLVDAIIDHIREISPGRNWDLVLDASGASPNGIPNILHAANPRDVTAEVIQSINQARGR